MRVTSRISCLQIPVKITAPNEIRPGTLQITHDDRFDPISGFPLMKSIEVRVQRA